MKVKEYIKRKVGGWGLFLWMIGAIEVYKSKSYPYDSEVSLNFWNPILFVFYILAFIYIMLKHLVSALTEGFLSMYTELNSYFKTDWSEYNKLKRIDYLAGKDVVE